MSDMKLIMEGWRQYSSTKKESTIFLLEHNDAYKVNFDSILEERKIDDAVRLWESSSEYELDKLLTELKLAGMAKQLASRVGEKINDFVYKLSKQAYELLQKGATEAKRVASVVKKITDTISKFCSKIPTVCKIAKFSAMVIAMFAIAAMFYSPDAQAALAAGDTPMPEETYNFLRGMLMDIVSDQPTGANVTKYIDIIDQLDKIQASPDITQIGDLPEQLQNALGYGSDMYKEFADMADKGELSTEQFNKIVKYFETLGETATATAEVITGPGFKSVKVSMDTAAAGPRPF